jgi:hypothetical protein
VENINLEAFMSDTMGNILSGAGTGAAAGSTFGPWGTAIGGLVGAVGGGLASRENKETKMQSKQRELVDQLLASLKGQGPYSDLFKADQETFNKSFRDPALFMFRNQVTPQIQQAYIASGQQRGTGMEDTLSRAGVELDQLLNQHFAQFQQNAQQNKMNAMNTLLGMGQGAPRTPSAGQAAFQGLAGYMQKPEFQESIENILSKRKGFEDIQDTYKPFTGKEQSYNYATGVMG